MGSDTSPQLLYEAAHSVALHLDGIFDDPVEFLLFAPPSTVTELQGLFPPHPNLHFFAAEEVISMEDEPLSAVRHKRHSSMVQGITSLAEGRIDAFVSAGNTGALIASTALFLPLLPRVSRPALMAMLPSQGGSVAVIDVGGNICCKAELLEQFAALGVAYQRCFLPKGSAVRVGLLNIGAESKKGTAEVRRAYDALQLRWPKEKDLAAHFIGNIEGRELFKGAVDVLVTDGFTGNVLLKTAEGISAYIFEAVHVALTDFSDPAIHQALEPLERCFHYAETPGALLAGADALVIKCHGSSSLKAASNAIKGAIHFLRNDLLARVKLHWNEI